MKIVVDRKDWQHLLEIEKSELMCGTANSDLHFFSRVRRGLILEYHIKNHELRKTDFTPEVGQTFDFPTHKIVNGSLVSI